MIFVIAYASSKKKIESKIHSSILLIAVFVNICVWFLEQIVDINFEFLSVSYIITELFLIGLHMIIQENNSKHTNQINSDEKDNNIPTTLTETENVDISKNDIYTQDISTDIPVEQNLKDNDINKNEDDLIKYKYFTSQLKNLTPKEQEIYDLYVAGKKTKEITEELNITENTLKYHNKNIYSKLGVNSRKQLLEFATTIELISAKK